MKVFPAIDIIDGKVVRLLKGDYGKVTNYSLSVVEAAKNFADCGAHYLHAVDLDGARSGRTTNADSVKKIVAATDMFVEIGGGIRTRERIQSYLDCGVGRVILGTVAVRDFSFVGKMAAIYGGKIAVGVDAADGKVATDGWRVVSDVNSLDFCKKLADAGVKSVIYTDISRDGAMNGTNLGIYRELMKIDGLEITASGGITYLDEIKSLRDAGVHAVIVGKALYEGKLDLKEVLAAAADEN